MRCHIYSPSNTHTILLDIMLKVKVKITLLCLIQFLHIYQLEIQ